MKSTKKAFIVLLSCFVLAFSFLIPVFFNNKTYQAKADSTYVSATFDSSNLFLIRLGWTSSSTTYSFGSLSTGSVNNLRRYFNYSFKLDYDSSSDNVKFYVKGIYDNGTYTYDQNATGSSSYNTWSNNLIVNFSDYSATKRSTKLYLDGSGYYTPILSAFDYYDPSVNRYLSLSELPTNFNTRPSMVISKIIFANYTNISSFGFSSTGSSYFMDFISTGYYNIVSFIDNLGFRFTFFIPMEYSSSESYNSNPYNYLFYREYFTSAGSNLSDNQYYEQGYNDGLLNNQENIYNNGYSAGNTVGYGAGYNAGLNDANQYTFYNLFGAVLDAPVQTLIGLLNFNLLGINLLSLFGGLLALALLLFVIKLLLGGK